MSTPIEDLERDHRNMARLLALIEHQVEGFQRGGTLDFDLLASVIDYARNFPDRFHHPREDVIFRRLAARYAPARVAIQRLVEEHAHLAELSATLAEAIRNVGLEADVPRAALARTAREYIDAYRRHMAEEERAIFALAKQRLSEGDWAAIDAALHAPVDPLFGPKVEQRYLRLHDRIIAIGA